MNSTYTLARTIAELRRQRLNQVLAQLTMGAAAGILLAASFIAWVCLH